MEELTSNCHNIRVVGENPVNLLNFKRALKINTSFITSTNRSRFIQNSLIDETIDLLVIDVDSCGSMDASYLIFLATCLTPWRPVVLITSNKLDTTTHQRFLSGGALAVILLTDGVSTTAVPK